MDDMRFLKLLREIKPVMYDNIGLVISFWHIYETLTPFGDTRKSILLKIEQLERKQNLKVFREDSVIYAVKPLP